MGGENHDVHGPRGANPPGKRVLPLSIYDLIFR